MNTAAILKWSALGAIVIAGLAAILLVVAMPVQAMVLPAEVAASVRIGGFGSGEGSVDFQSLLADALGITIEELETAQQAAFEASIQVAVEAGDITQDEADQILDGERRPMPGHGPLGPGLRRSGFGQADPYHQFLADELGINLDELQDAMQQAHAAAIEQLTEEGVLTEEQAELASAAQALRAYINPRSIIAEALGISAESLEQAWSDGMTLSELIEAQGMDSETFEQNQASAREAAVAQAVVDGVITQDQAEQLESSRDLGLGIGPRFRLKCDQNLGSEFGPRSRFGAGHGPPGGRLFGPWRHGPASESQDL
jgi:uncharacterized protein YidB (DUF937 family)